MADPPPGAQISPDGHYWWNVDTGDPSEPQRWELLDTPQQPAQSSQPEQNQSVDPGQSTAPAQASEPNQSVDPAQPNQSTDPAANQSTDGDVTIDFEYTTSDDSGVSLDELIASGWEPESDEEHVS